MNLRFFSVNKLCHNSLDKFSLLLFRRRHLENEEKLFVENQYLTSIIVPLIVPSHSKANSIDSQRNDSSNSSKQQGMKSFQFARNVA
jgi:hypothetical protein